MAIVFYKSQKKLSKDFCELKITEKMYLKVISDRWATGVRFRNAASPAPCIRVFVWLAPYVKYVRILSGLANMFVPLIV